MDSRYTHNNYVWGISCAWKHGESLLVVSTYSILAKKNSLVLKSELFDFDVIFEKRIICTQKYFLLFFFVLKVLFLKPFFETDSFSSFFVCWTFATKYSVILHSLLCVVIGWIANGALRHTLWLVDSYCNIDHLSPLITRK